MHSIYQGKKIACKRCGEKYFHPLCDIYEYEGVDRFFTKLPETEVGYCADCNKFVCIQKGIKYDNVKRLRNNAEDYKEKGYYDKLLEIMQGKDGLDSCVICNGTNITSLKDSVCPSCGCDEFSIVDDFKHGDVVFHFSRKYISPKLLEKKPEEMKIKEPFRNSNIDNKCIEENKHSVVLDFIKWIGVLPISIIAWVTVYWIINLLYNIFSPVEMTQWAITIMSSGGSGMAFVLAGSLLAPRGKKIVSIVLATIMCVLALVSMIFSLYGYGDNSIMISVLSGISTIAGCIFGSVQMHEDKL